MPISDEKIGDFLERLAGRVPVPGGGAAAALHAAHGAALLGMVARYTTGRQYAEHEAAIGRIIDEVDELRAPRLVMITTGRPVSRSVVPRVPPEPS